MTDLSNDRLDEIAAQIEHDRRNGYPTLLAEQLIRELRDARAEIVGLQHDALLAERDDLQAKLAAAERQLAAVRARYNGTVVIKRSSLEGWWDTPPLTGSDWRAFAESLPAGEYATTLLCVADAMDAAALTEGGAE